MERNSYHSIAKMKYEDTKPIEFVDMEYKKEEAPIHLKCTL